MPQKKTTTTTTPPPCVHAQKGRSRELVRRRNLKLLQRYYHLIEVQRRRSDDALRQLSIEEFFVSEARIWRIVNTNLHILDKIRDGVNIDINADFENNPK
ncbi:MAG: hypothetical protein NT004_06270 [Bacteroidetes bacterium]|nr:hypothetical protein [Bacteroidota bacterium]